MLLLGVVVAIRQVTSGRAALSQLAVSADGTSVAATFADGHVCIYDAKTDSAKIVETGSTPLVPGLSLPTALSADGRYLATYSTMDDPRKGQIVEVVIWDGEHGQVLHRIAVADYVTNLKFSPDGRQLICTLQTAPATAIDVQAGQLHHGRQGAVRLRMSAK